MATTVKSGLAKPHKRSVAAPSDLIQADRPPLTTAELAHIVGMSATFIRSEIKNGALGALALGRGRKRVFRIPVAEARRYLQQLGLL